MEKSPFTVLWKLSWSTVLFNHQSEASERWMVETIFSLSFERLFHLKKNLFFFFLSISINISQNLVKHQRNAVPSAPEESCLGFTSVEPNREILVHFFLSSGTQLFLEKNRFLSVMFILPLPPFQSNCFSLKYSDPKLNLQMLLLWSCAWSHLTRWCDKVTERPVLSGLWLWVTTWPFLSL